MRTCRANCRRIQHFPAAHRGQKANSAQKQDFRHVVTGNKEIGIEKLLERFSRKFAGFVFVDSDLDAS